MKCLYCGKNILFGKVRLADGYIHTKCFRKLGFLDGYDDTMDNTPFDVIKDGYDTYQRHLKERYWEKNKADELDPEELEAAKKRIRDQIIGSVKVADYGQERDLICTEEEREIYNRVCEVLDDSTPRLVRVSKSYVSIKYKGYDLMRFKYTNRSRWFNFPMLEKGSMKHYIDDLDDFDEYTVVIEDSAKEIKRLRNE